MSQASTQIASQGPSGAKYGFIEQLAETLNKVGVSIDQYPRLTPEVVDDPRIQRAIDDVSVKVNKKIIFPSAQYVLSDTAKIYVKDGVSLIGINRKTSQFIVANLANNANVIYNNISTVGMFVLLGNNLIQQLGFINQTAVNVVETSMQGNFIHILGSNINIIQCDFENSPNDAIYGGKYSGTDESGNPLPRITDVNIQFNSFKNTGRFDITMVDANRFFFQFNTSNNSGACCDVEPSGDYNEAKDIIITNNIVINAAYTAFQVSASNSAKKGKCTISNNVIGMSSTYINTIAELYVLGVRMAEANITGNTITGRTNFVFDVNATPFCTIAGNTVNMTKKDAGTVLRVNNNSLVLMQGNNISLPSAQYYVNALNTSTVINQDANTNLPNNQDGTSKILGYAVSSLILGGQYQQSVGIAGNAGLGSRAFFKIGNLGIDTLKDTVGSGSYVRFKNLDLTTTVFEINNDNRLLLKNVPTSSTGLPSGAIWNNAGVLNIVP